MVSFSNIVSPITNLFGDQKNPADAAMPYLDKAGKTYEKYAQPYIEQGQSFGDPLSEQYQQMLSDPAAFLESLMGGYEPSSGYQLKLDEANKAAGATAAAGGYRGTPQDVMDTSRITERLMGDDMQSWLNNVMGIQNTGLTGGQNMYTTGANTASGLSSSLGNLYGQQGQYAFQGQREDNQRQQDLMKMFSQIAGSAAGFM